MRLTRLFISLLILMPETADDGIHCSSLACLLLLDLSSVPRKIFILIQPIMISRFKLQYNYDYFIAGKSPLASKRFLYNVSLNEDG